MTTFTPERQAPTMTKATKNTIYLTAPRFPFPTFAFSTAPGADRRNPTVLTDFANAAFAVVASHLATVCPSPTHPYKARGSLYMIPAGAAPPITNLLNGSIQPASPPCTNISPRRVRTHRTCPPHAATSRPTVATVFPNVGIPLADVGLGCPVVVRDPCHLRSPAAVSRGEWSGSKVRSRRV